MKKTFNILSLIFIFAIFILVGCNQTTKYYAEYETNGASAIEPTEFLAGEKLTLPEEPTKNNSSFAGWYLDEELTQKFDSEKPLDKQNIKLYAKWNVEISFVTNNETKLTSIYKNCGDILILPNVKSNAGYQFAGWYYDNNFENKVENIYTVGNDPITFYGRWYSIEEGTAIDLLSHLTANEPTHYVVNETQESIEVETTISKTTWSYLSAPITTNLDGYSVIRLNFKGSKNQSFIAKLEGGGAPAIEQKFVLTGEEQTEYWEIPSSNIASQAGQKLLIFIDGGYNGSEIPTQVTFKEISFVKMTASDLDSQEVLIFDTLGGSQVDAIIAAYDSEIEFPEDPTKPGYVFDGWYIDEQLTEEFSATKMPHGPTTIYAKWSVAPTHTVTFITNCDLTVDPITVNEGLKFEAPNLEVLGWEFKGWYKNSSLTEKADFTMGTTDITLYAKWATLADLSNKNNPIAVNTNWLVNESGHYTISETANNLTITATPDKTTFSYIYRELTGLDLTHTNALHLVFSGKIGDRFMIKYNDKVEIIVNIEKANQEEWIYLDTPIDPTEKLILFYQPNATVSENTNLTFTKFELLNPINVEIKTSFASGWFSNQAGHYEVVEDSNGTSITALTGKTAWSFAKVDLGTIQGLDINNVHTINLTFTGEEGHSFIIKYNNRVEQKVTLTGQEQTLSIKLTEKIDLSINNHLIIFIDGATAQATPTTITFTKMELVSKYVDPNVEITYEYEEVDIKKGWFEVDKDSYIFEENADNTVITATPNKKQWSLAKYDISGLEYNDFYAAKLILKGPAGHTVIFKYNNATEEKITLTGQRQEIEVVFNKALDKSKALYIFIEGGKTLTENIQVTFEKIALIRKIEVIGGETAPDVDPTYTSLDIKKGWFEVDKDSYIIEENADNTVITATTNKKIFSLVKYEINDMPVDGAKGVKLVLTGPAGKSILFKYNNAKEQKVTLTGEEQEVVIEFSVALDKSKPLYIFVAPNSTLTENVSVTFTTIELLFSE